MALSLKTEVTAKTCMEMDGGESYTHKWFKKGDCKPGALSHCLCLDESVLG